MQCLVPNLKSQLHISDNALKAYFMLKQLQRAP